MTNTARKRCPKCCPDTERWTNTHDRATSEDGSPVWRCRCCSNELLRRTRRSSVQVELDNDPKLRDAVDALFDELSADIKRNA
jgi:hypothetical protein